MSQQMQWSDLINDAKLRFSDYQKKYIKNEVSSEDSSLKPDISFHVSESDNKNIQQNTYNCIFLHSANTANGNIVSVETSQISQNDTVNILLLERNNIQRLLSVSNKQNQQLKGFYIYYFLDRASSHIHYFRPILIFI
ncbi:hypothetical protein HZS_1969 [Henneguya salminicola]|nr:hypothetical protein HZS_1969 [Henneguya salminicola]